MSNSLEKILECPICLDTYKKPKVLPCQHSFCLSCIYQTYVEKTRKGEKLICPLCNRQIDLKSTTKNKQPQILTLDEFKTRLADNLTLIELSDVMMKPTPTPRQNIYKNEEIENRAAFSKSNSSVAAAEKPTVLPRYRKPPPPEPPSSNNNVTAKAVPSRLSIIPEEKSPPNHPLRRLPSNEIKLLVKLEAELANVVTIKKFLLDSCCNIFVSFMEENAGIRKYEGVHGQFCMKFAGTGVIVDFGLDQKSNEIICIVASDGNQTYLQSYDSENGQRLKCLRYFTSIENFKLITSDKQNKNEYILAGPLQLASYNSKSNALKNFPNLPNLPDFAALAAMDCSKTGTLYLLYGNQAINQPIIFGLSLVSRISFSLPIFSDDITAIKSFSITANNFYICDLAARCVHTYRKIKPKIAKADTILCKSNYYNWKPEVVCCSDKKVFVYDSEKKSIFLFDDKQAV